MDYTSTERPTPMPLIILPIILYAVGQGFKELSLMISPNSIAFIIQCCSLISFTLSIVIALPKAFKIGKNGFKMIINITNKLRKHKNTKKSKKS